MQVLPAVLGLLGCSGGVSQDDAAPTTSTLPGDGSGALEAPGGPGSGAPPSNSPQAPTDADGGAGATTSSPTTPAGTGNPPANPPPVENPALAPTTFECDPNLLAQGPPLRRLSQKQYANSIRDLATHLLEGTPSALADAGELEALLGGVPEDERLKLPQELHGTYRRLDQRVQQPHVDAWYGAGIDVGKWLTASARFSDLVGDCGQMADSACVDAFIGRLGRVAFRRPLESDEIDFYHGFYAPSTGIDAAGFADIIAAMLNAPDFLYVVEGRGEELPDRPGTFQLTAHEIAARLSYHFWNTAPDAELSALADSGELLDPNTYRAEVNRLFEDSRTAAVVTDFYDEWLKLDDLSELDRNNDSALFQAFAGENLPSGELREAMRDEVFGMLRHYTFTQPGGVEQLLTSPYSFATSSELAELYGAEAWDGLGTPPSLGNQRPGLLTRAAFLATGTANTRPIMRGLFIRTTLLCDAIAPPPAEAGATPPELSPDLTTREVVEQLTAPEACYGCHQTFINPLGFALEGFDGLGRVRSEQRLFDDAGDEIGQKPIDTSSVPQVVLGDDAPSTGPADLMGLIAESGKVEACLARQYFRFTFGRWEQVASDGCTLEQMRQAITSEAGLSGLLRDVALSEAFQTRTAQLADEAAADEGVEP